MLMETLHPKELISFSQSLGEPDWMVNLRSSAWERSLLLPWPSFKYGITMALNARHVDFAGQDFRSAFHRAPVSVNVEGNAIAGRYSEVPRESQEILRPYLFQLLKSANAIDAIHQALSFDPVLVIIPEGKTANVRLQIPITDRVQCDHVIVVAGPASTLTISDETTSQIPEALHTKMVEVFVGESATVRFTSIQNASRTTTHFTKKIASVAANGRMHWLDCSVGAQLAQVEVTTNLDGPGAESKNWGMFFGVGNQQYDLAGTVFHNAPRTIANMLTKGAVTDHAKAIYRGLMKIARHAPHSNGFQRADTLILSENAEADNIPALEIDNADVKCSHASTIGKVDEEQLFYLMSRGLSETEARRMLVRSLFAPLLQAIDDPSQQLLLQGLIEERI